MLMPKKTKFRKVHRGRRRGETKGQSTVQFGDYGLKAIDRGWITNRQIEAARIAMTRKIKRGGKVWINVFPDKSYTKKPAETRMGSGKGSPAADTVEETDAVQAPAEDAAVEPASEPATEPAAEPEAPAAPPAVSGP